MSEEKEIKVVLVGDAGVGKTKGGEELQKSGGLKNFKTGYCFKDAGGTESIYNDMIPGEHMTINREGRNIDITSNVFIRDSEYTLGVTADYMRILDQARLWCDCMDFIK